MAQMKDYTITKRLQNSFEKVDVDSHEIAVPQSTPTHSIQFHCFKPKSAIYRLRSSKKDGTAYKTTSFKHQLSDGTKNASHL